MLTLVILAGFGVWCITALSTTALAFSVLWLISTAKAAKKKRVDKSVENQRFACSTCGAHNLFVGGLE